MGNHNTITLKSAAMQTHAQPPMTTLHYLLHRAREETCRFTSSSEAFPNTHDIFDERQGLDGMAVFALELVEEEAGVIDVHYLAARWSVLVHPRQRFQRLQRNRPWVLNVDIDVLD